MTMTSSRRPKTHHPAVCHVIGNLHVGGAETMLLRLLSQLKDCEWNFHVISLIDRGPIGERIESLGIPVTALGMRRGAFSPGSMFRLIRALRDVRPQLVQTWMYHADLLGATASRLGLGRIPVVWNIRHSGLEKDADKRSTRWVVAANARASRWLPNKIIVNSQAGRRVHEGLGFARERMVVIPNGFEGGAIPDRAQARAKLRGELGVPADAPLVGLVARYHPVKDHATFVRAAAHIAARCAHARFVCCGKNVDWNNGELAAHIDAAGLRGAFHLLGHRDDVSDVQAALDVAVSSSRSEGFPNVVGEAMMRSVPCVVTDVGGSAELVGETGRVAPPQRPEAIAAACLELLTLSPAERMQLGDKARRRIEEQFSLEAIAQRYALLWQGLLPGAVQESRRA